MKIDNFVNDLKKLYKLMDDTYDEVANQYGFNCTGCKDNCCMTRFYHHTHIEREYLIKGFKSLEKEKQDEIIDKSLNVCKEIEKSELKGEQIRVMCPLNYDDLCILYDFRPMICRLHGIAHEIRRGPLPVNYSPGCEIFTELCEKKNIDYIPFDRTPLYMKMALLEKSFKEAINEKDKIKMTVAEMILYSARS